MDNILLNWCAGLAWYGRIAYIKFFVSNQQSNFMQINANYRSIFFNLICSQSKEYMILLRGYAGQTVLCLLEHESLLFTFKHKKIILIMFVLKDLNTPLTWQHNTAQKHAHRLVFYRGLFGSYTFKTYIFLVLCHKWNIIYRSL